ncbi:MAG TPA: hypothetical protein VFJ52_06315 [Terriglobia bacterium]|nr:hypothetical protein [Terriglobia bacterium]
MVEAADARTRSVSNVIAGVGLALGGLLGLAGTLVAARNLQSACWAVDGVGLIVAGVILGLKYFREGNDIIGAGFLVFAMGSAVMLVGTATTLQASVPSFGAGTALWVAGLLMISFPREFAFWTRLAGLIASVLFAMVSGRIVWGEQLLPTARPFPYFAYPFLVLALVGWIWKLRRAA